MHLCNRLAISSIEREKEKEREKEREQERKRQKCSGFQRDLLPVRAIYTRVSWTEIMQNSRGLTSGTFIGRPIIKYRGDMQSAL